MYVVNKLQCHKLAAADNKLSSLTVSPSRKWSVWWINKQTVDGTDSAVKRHIYPRWWFACEPIVVENYLFWSEYVVLESFFSNRPLQDHETSYFFSHLLPIGVQFAPFFFWPFKSVCLSLLENFFLFNFHY